MAGGKLTREEQGRRRFLEKAFHPLFASWAKAAGWGYRKPNAFRVVGDWLVVLHPVIWTDDERGQVWALMKPRILDDLVSRILGHGGLDGVPPSRLVAGPHCLVRPMLVADIEDCGDPARMAARAATFADDALAHAERSSLDDFVAFSADDRPPGEVAVNHVAALILAGRNGEASALCERAIAAAEWGGPARLTADGDMVGFFTLARVWLAGQQR